MHLLFQYVKGLLDLIGLPPEQYESFFPDHYGPLSQCTKTQFQKIHSPAGKMILLRVLQQDDGEYFADVLWRLKNEVAPELDKLFCVILDDQVGQAFS
jgi:hypothetical protein